MKINRYNRSCIGLMEMDKEGIWCKFDDVDTEYQSMEEYSERMWQGYLREHKRSCKISNLSFYFQAKITKLFVICSFSLLINLWMFIK